MKKLLSIISGVLLVASAAYFTLGTIISAFYLDVDMRSLLFILLVAAVFAVTLTNFFKTGGIFIYLFAAACVMVFMWYHEMLAGAHGVLYRLTYEFSLGLPVPVLFEGAVSGQNETLLFIAAVGVVLTALLTIAVRLRRSAVFTVLITLPVVAVSLILEYCPPEARYLIGVVAVYITMMLSTALQPVDVKKRAVAVFPALVLTMVLVGAAYLAAGLKPLPLSESLRTLGARINYAFVDTYDFSGFSGLGWPNIEDSIWRFDDELVDVADAGTRTLTGKVLLEVEAERAGEYYLRGFSLTRFNGRTWVTNPSDIYYNSNAKAFQMPVLNIIKYNELSGDDEIMDITLNVTVRGDSSNIMYMPYFTADSSINSPNNYTTVFYNAGNQLFTYAEYAKYALREVMDRWSFDNQQAFLFKEIDAATADELREIAKAADIDLDGDRVTLSAQVAEYISSVAKYTLNPPVTPENADFTLHFLRESKRGYCIHFATAATLMLRALGVPARVVCGFVATVPQDSAKVELTDGNAHAWVEVHYTDIGWVPLEVTPGGGHTGATGEFLPVGTEARDALGQNDEDPMFTPMQSAVPDNESTPDATPTPDTSSDGGENAKHDKGGYIVVLAAVCILVIVGLPVRRVFVLRHRAQMFRQPSANAAVLCAWRYILRLYSRRNPPKEIEDLALKARFSPHTLNGQERSAVLGFAVRRANEVYDEKSFIERLVMRYIRCLH